MREVSGHMSIRTGPHLIGRDKSQVKEKEDGGVHHLSQNGPSVIFLVRYQVAIATLPPKVIRKPCSPDRQHEGHDCQPEVGDTPVVEVVVEPEHPRVHHWGDGPDLVDLGDVVAQDGPHKGIYDHRDQQPPVLKTNETGNTLGSSILHRGSDRVLLQEALAVRPCRSAAAEVPEGFKKTRRVCVKR